MDNEFETILPKDVWEYEVKPTTIGIKDYQSRFPFYTIIIRTHWIDQTWTPCCSKVESVMEQEYFPNEKQAVTWGKRKIRQLNKIKNKEGK